MAAAFPVLLGVVVIDATNKAIRFTEGGVSAVVSLTEGSYFLRGDQLDGSDLCKEIKDALDSHAGANTYAVTLALSTNPADPTATVTVTRSTGIDTFAILWADALTTFDEGLVGFTNVNTAADAAAKVSTLSPSCLWVGNDIYRSLEPVPSFVRRRSRARSGKVRAVERMSTRDRFWVQEHIEAKRMNEEEIAADPTRALSRFIDRQADGRRLEFHDGAIASGFALSALSTSTKIGTAWHLDDDFYPERSGFAQRVDGAPLYSFQGTLLPYVA